jgi:cytochrome c-type biogenesis protein CcmH
MVFWIAASGISLVVAAMIAGALIRLRDRASTSASDVQVYREQLRDVDRDLARGVLTEAEAEAVRTEVARRLLEADAAATRADALGEAPRAARLAGVALTAGAVIAGALAIYGAIGAPGYPDLPLAERLAAADEARASRPGQAVAEAEAALSRPPPPEISDSFAELMTRLRAAVAERPDDLQGHVLLARNEAALGRFEEAITAQLRVIDIRGAEAEAGDFATLADMLILAAGGYVSPEAEGVLNQALTRDPANGTARYYTGLMFAQTGRPDVAFRIWRLLLEESDPEEPWVPPIRAQIGELAMIAGVDYVLPAEGAAPRGPSREDIEAAGEMSAADRMEMIRGMVASLSDRLATEGGPPEDWARLIRAHGVLGNRDAAAAIWSEAQQVFPDDAARIPILQAARDAGVAE